MCAGKKARGEIEELTAGELTSGAWQESMLDSKAGGSNTHSKQQQ
jgi:hypothetical protein